MKNRPQTVHHQTMNDIISLPLKNNKMAELQTKGLSNLQLELLKIFSFEIEEEQLLEIKAMLSNYFL